MRFLNSISSFSISLIMYVATLTVCSVPETGSEILSYSRLLALGLATGSIASVINLIGTMPKNPFVKAVLLIVVFIVGHTANLAINLLGAYVHTDRLQFVELFSKFYTGGGREFAPLTVNTQYIKFKEENNNE